MPTVGTRDRAWRSGPPAGSAPPRPACCRWRERTGGTPNTTSVYRFAPLPDWLKLASWPSDARQCGARCATRSRHPGYVTQCSRFRRRSTSSVCADSSPTGKGSCAVRSTRRSSRPARCTRPPSAAGSVTASAAGRAVTWSRSPRIWPGFPPRCAARSSSRSSTTWQAAAVTSRAWEEMQVRARKPASLPRRSGNRSTGRGAAQEPVVLRAVPGSMSHIRRTRWAWEKWAPLGCFLLIAGEPGLGKGVFTCCLLAGLTRGTTPGDLKDTPVNALWIGTEDSWEEVVLPRLAAAGADVERVFHLVVDTPGACAGRRPRPAGALRARRRPRHQGDRVRGDRRPPDRRSTITRTPRFAGRWRRWSSSPARSNCW